MLRYFHYRKLSKESQNAYKAIVEAIKGFKENAVISSVVNLQVVINAVKNDNPHFFFVDWYSILYNSSFSISTLSRNHTINVSFHTYFVSILPLFFPVIGMYS